MVRRLNLRAMSVDDLLSLREQLMSILPTRLKTERRELESRLARLQGVDHSRKIGGRVQVVPANTGISYQNPNNPDEVWSGRGRRPLWLSEAIKKGKKLDDFRSGKAAITRPSERRRKRAN